MDELEAHHSLDIRLQSFAPFWAEVRIVGGPQQERGMIEASEPVEQLERRLVVRGVELPSEEPPRFGAAIPVAEVRADVAIEQLGCQHATVTDRVALAIVSLNSGRRDLAHSSASPSGGSCVARTNGRS